ncbi:MAG TPA: hypothetical protein PK593_09385, partial [Thermomicrobiales bacterium]|nr:hypothetical protein [Thermomicrobiales bacterium]
LELVQDFAFLTGARERVPVIGKPLLPLLDLDDGVTPGALKGGVQVLARHPLRDEILIGSTDGIPQIYRMNRITVRKIGDNANLIRKFPIMQGRIFGVDIAPGTWSNNVAAAGCYWERVSDFSGDVVRIIDSGDTHATGVKTITIAPTDAGFKSWDCGTWTRVGG